MEMYILFIILEGDQIFDELSGTAKKIKNGALQIKDELQLQSPLLDKLEKNVWKRIK